MTFLMRLRALRADILLMRLKNRRRLHNHLYEMRREFGLDFPLRPCHSYHNCSCLQLPSKDYRTRANWELM